MAATTLRSIGLLVLPAFLASACATGGGESRELIEAGRRIRREQTPPTAAQLRLEVDSFLDNELPLLRRKAETRLGREARGWRLTFAGGAALGVLAASSGSVKGSSGSVKPILVGTGAVATAVSALGWASSARRVAACSAFFDGASADVASWRANGIPPGEGPVAPDVWRAWVDRVAAIRGLETCGRPR